MDQGVPFLVYWKEKARRALDAHLGLLEPEDWDMENTQRGRKCMVVGMVVIWKEMGGSSIEPK